MPTKPKKPTFAEHIVVELTSRKFVVAKLMLGSPKPAYRKIAECAYEVTAQKIVKGLEAVDGSSND